VGGGRSTRGRVRHGFETIVYWLLDRESEEILFIYLFIYLFAYNNNHAVAHNNS